MKYQINSLENLVEFVEQFLPFLEKNKLFLLHGEMGVGKTTFVQNLLTRMGISELNGSPTYSLINSYDSPQYGNIHHLDLYRLKNSEEAYDIGLEDILDDNSYCFIEWPEKVIDMLPENYCSLYFSLKEDFSRTVEIIDIKKV